MIGIFAIAAVVMASSPAEPQSTVRPSARPADIEVQVQPLFEGRSTPFAGIFPARPSQPSQDRDRVYPTPIEVRPKTRIACGMVVIEGDPKVDPKILWKATVNPDPKMVMPRPPCPEDKR